MRRAVVSSWSRAINDMTTARVASPVERNGSTADWANTRFNCSLGNESDSFDNQPGSGEVGNGSAPM